MLHLSEKNSLCLSGLLMLEIARSPRMHRCIPSSNRCQWTWPLTFESVFLACFLLHSFAPCVLGEAAAICRLKVYGEKCAHCSGDGFFFYSVHAVYVFSVHPVGQVCVPGEWMTAI